MIAGVVNICDRERGRKQQVTLNVQNGQFERSGRQVSDAWKMGFVRGLFSKEFLGEGIRAAGLYIRNELREKLFSG